MSIKIGLAQCLFPRALRVCSPEFLDDEISRIKLALKKLAYPENILKKALWKARKTHFRGPKPIISELDDNDDDSDRVIGNIVVPYVPTLEKFKRPLRNLKYGLIFQYKNKLSTCLTKNSPGALETGVYKIPCKVCPKLYIGETGRSISERMSGHKTDVKNSTLIWLVGLSTIPLKLDTVLILKVPRWFIAPIICINVISLSLLLSPTLTNLIRLLI